MRWQGRRQSGNVEDRRGQPGLGYGSGSGSRIPIGFPRTARGGGGLGIGAIAAILIVGWVLGVNPIDLLSGIEGGAPVSVGGGDTGTVGTPSDDAGKFVAAVLADTEDTWTKIFAANGKQYVDPTLVLFTGSTSSACGFASSASGPFYCSQDAKVYIDLDFYRQLREQFNAPGDFAEAYVIAHEVGHHVQDLLGTLGKVDDQRARSSEADSNALSVRLELQADCYAGIWAHAAEAEGILDVGDIDEALNAAAQIGDDTLQRRSQGYVVPETFTHGTAAQRSRWFKRGYNDGDLTSCDTFNAATL